jgi:hypothetical protein
VFDSDMVDRWLEPLSRKTKDYKFGICCFSARQRALIRKSKNLLAQNEDNVYDMSTHGLVFQ